VHLDAGQPQQARATWGAALRLLESLDHPEAAEVRARLTALPAG
jgi:hypothetical protein